MALMTISPLVALAVEKVDWRDAHGVRRQLSTAVGVHWSQVPLRRALQRLSHSQRVAIFLDRRIDPGQLVNVSSSASSLEETLQQLAASISSEVANIGPVVYLGPVGTKNKVNDMLRAVRQQVSRTPHAAGRRLSARTPWQWKSLSQPSTIFSEITKRFSLKANGLEKVEYDLWAAADLPKLNFAEIVTLLCHGMELSAELSPDGGSVSFSRVARAEIDSARSPHIQSALPRKPPSSRAGGRKMKGTQLALKRFTLRYKNRPASKLIRLVAQQNSLQLSVAGATRERLEANIDINLREATFDELMEGILRPLGLRHELDGGQLVIRRDANGDE